LGSHYGKGRVYTTKLGHTWLNEVNPNFRCKEFQVLVAHGVEWAATGQVTIPAPAAAVNPGTPKPAHDIVVFLERMFRAFPDLCDIYLP
jgi:hypothetical protein